jgi:hypothetical protein
MHRALLVVAIAAACGPSSSEIKTAKTTTYNAEPIQILKLAAQAAEDEHYKIGDVDEGAVAFATEVKSFSSTGDLESAGAGGVVMLRPGSVQVIFIVKVVATEGHQVAVTVTPKTFQVVAGSPKPRELGPDDPYLPSFVTGRADALALAIYQHAKAYAMAPPGGP